MHTRRFHLEASGRDVGEVSKTLIDRLVAIDGGESSSSDYRAIESIRSTGANPEEALKSLIDDAIGATEQQGMLPQFSEFMHADWVAGEVWAWAYLRFGDASSSRIARISREAFAFRNEDGRLSVNIDILIQRNDLQ